MAVTRNGSPVPGAKVHMAMRDHQFLFGCDCYCAGTYGDAAKEKTYRDLFGGLFNFATLPFYWNQYEPVKGQTEEKRLSAMLDWCKGLGLVTKGHPLAWNTLVPGWITDEYDIERLLRLRIEDIMARFGDTVEFWDVFNEITTMERYDNPISHWIEKVGKAGAVEFAAKCVYDVKPGANLLYNDYNLWPADMELLLRQLREDGLELAAVGLQSHMHQRLWTLEETWTICERYAQFGWPLHFTEATVLSGQCNEVIGYNEGDVNTWQVLPGDLEHQRDYTVDFYTLLFSHPAVEAITWWDFPDNQWMGAPGGLATEDLSPKPAYDALVKLVKQDWWSDEAGETNSDGAFGARVFCGNYDITVEADGQTVKLNTDILRERGRSADQIIHIHL